MSRELAEFYDPRLVAIYETVNFYRPGTQPDFYANLAAEMSAESIIDIGCGTGLIARELARQGLNVIGLEPAPEMIAAGKLKPGGKDMQWINGTTADLGERNAAMAMMSGHVAQFFLTDDAWNTALNDIAKALRPNGYLAFEARNPQAREWTNWNSANRFVVQDPTAGEIESWTEFESYENDVVSTTNYYRFIKTGELMSSGTQLRFRSLEQFESSLTNAGFTIEKSYGNWQLDPINSESPEFILVAQLRSL